MTHAVTIEKRDAAGRLIARVRLADGVLDGPGLFYAADGETVIAEARFDAGRPVPCAPVPAPASPFAIPPAPAGDSPF